MTQEKRRNYLIEHLKNENRSFRQLRVPQEERGQKDLLRSLMNVRPPKAIPEEFAAVQDAYLQAEREKKGIVSPDDLTPLEEGIYLWQGDITRLAADAIVNAANSALLGCFIPCHGCIDNAIHSAAGIQLRLECSRIMEKQGSEEPTGRAKITQAHNLPSRYILHTVGPIIRGSVTQRDCDLLADCYRSCLKLAAEYRLKNVAFCSISTGEFHFPNRRAAEIAVETVREYRKNDLHSPEVIFNVFKDDDYEIYRRLLGENEGENE